MLTATLVIGGALLGALVSEAFFGGVFGALLGWLASRSHRSRREIAELRRELATLQTRMDVSALNQSLRATAEATPPEPSAPEAPQLEPSVSTAPEAPSAEDTIQPEAPDDEIAVDPILAASDSFAATASEPGDDATEGDTAEPPPSDPAVAGPLPGVPTSPADQTPSSPSFGDKLEEAIAEARAYLLGVNTVVQVGVVILLVGIGLLGKWAADNALFPIELRLALAALFGIALLGIGFRLRTRRAGYAVVLQGGGIGTIYLVTFFALRSFALITAGPAFLILVILTASTIVLALLQDAKSLAVFGALGGFMAPVVASSGEGSHVALFGYFALLNLGILTIAWFKAWRELNLVGFVFTFAIGGLWGADSYLDEHYVSTQLFLALFVLIFTAIPVLYAWRQAPKLRGLVDGTLVFGTPIVGFGFQSRLVDTFEYGLAVSSIALAALYISLAVVLFRLAPAWARALIEAFIALAVGFATMSVPFALQAEWVTLGWALEGVGLVWIGLRQKRRLPRLSGMLLQIGASIAVLFRNGVGSDEVAVFNGAFFSSLSIGASGIAIAYLVHRYRERLHRVEAALSPAFLAWGVTWWLLTQLVEAARVIDDRELVLVSLAIFATSALLADVIARRAAWRTMHIPAFFLAPVGLLHVAIWGAAVDAPFDRGGWLGWPMMWLAGLWILRGLHAVVNRSLVVIWHVQMLLWGASIAAWESYARVDAALLVSSTWAQCAQVIAVLIIVLFVSGRSWAKHLQVAYSEVGALILLGFSILWALGTNIQSTGDAFPLPTIPILNPFDLTLALIGLTLAHYVYTLGRNGRLTPERRKAVAIIGVALAFFALNASLLRAIHHATGVRYTFESLWSSVVVQAALSIFWTLLALASMVYATRRARRTVWMVAAGLLAVVVIKLFVVDLSTLGTGARIVSFLVVGVLMLLVGYVSPVPPNREVTA